MENINWYFSLLSFILVPFTFLYGQDTLRFDYFRGVQYGIEGDFVSARTCFSESLSADSLYVPAKMNLAVVEETLGNKLSKDAAVLYFQAIQLGNRDSLDGKIEKLTSALQINPGFGLAYNERGIAWASLSEYNKAIMDYDSALVFLSDYPEIYFNKALSCDKSDRFQEALAAFIKFVEYAHSIYKPYIVYANGRIKDLQRESDP